MCIDKFFALFYNYYVCIINARRFMIRRMSVIFLGFALKYQERRKNEKILTICEKVLVQLFARPVFYGLGGVRRVYSPLYKRQHHR